MPFTPLHFGPATLVKAIIPSQFSLFIFCYSQVITDIEVAYRYSTDQLQLHGFAHTYIGAVVVGILYGLTGHWVHIHLLHPALAFRFRKFMVSAITLKVSIISALLGTVSHVLLDSFMHADMEPLWPISTSNDFLDLIPLWSLYLFTVITGLGDFLWWKRRMVA